MEPVVVKFVLCQHTQKGNEGKNVKLSYSDLVGLDVLGENYDRSREKKLLVSNLSAKGSKQKSFQHLQYLNDE